MLIRKGFKYRIYPTEEQKRSLAIQFGHARFVYNYYLKVRKEHFFEHGRGLSRYDTQEMLKNLKRTEAHKWLKQGDSQVLQYALRNLEQAYQNFFRMCREATLPRGNGKPRRDGMRKGYPSPHRKHDRQSITYPQRFQVNGSQVYLPKVGWVRTIFHRPYEGQMKNCTVTKTKSGKYFVSLQCSVEIPEPNFGGEAVGIDVGLRRYATLSKPLPDGRTVIEHPKYLRQAEKKLARLQRRLSRTKKGSKGREKVRLKLSRQHEKVANQRCDFLHQESRKIVDAFGHIGLETLNIKGMVRNRKLAKSISDSGWYMFSQFITYKAGWSGSYVERFDRFYPSSRLCKCGHINTDLKLGQSQWTCPECGRTHDRDDNAASNLEPTVGATERRSCSQGQTPDGDRVRPATPLCVEGAVDEAGSKTPKVFNLG